AAIVEEGRIHLDISLVFAVESSLLRSSNDEAKAELAKQVRDILMQMRIAGGSVIESHAPRYKQRPYIVSLPDSEYHAESCVERFRKLKLQLLPGFALVERTDLLEQRHRQLQVNQPDAT